MIRERIFQNGDHSWFLFGRDPDKPASLSETNQVVVCSGDSAVLIDPGGLEVFPAVLAALTEAVPAESIRSIILTHSDPDACSSTPLWNQVCQNIETIYAPEIDLKSLSHLDSTLAFTPIPNDGTEMTIGNIALSIIPAYHLPSAGACSVFDPEARVLYSGDMGSVEDPGSETFVGLFEEHNEALTAWHQRRLVSPHACDDWIARVSGLDIEMIVPHHGPVFRGKNTPLFFDWIARLPIGPISQQTQDAPVEAAEPSLEATMDQISSSMSLSEPQEASHDPLMPVEEFGLDDPLILSDPIAGSTPDSPPEKVAVETERDKVAEDYAALLGEESTDEVYQSNGAPETGQQYRLVTRSDFDGLVCAVLFEEMEMIDDIVFVHPNDMQEGRVEITGNDIITNLPYVHGCHLAFDHHESEITRLGKHFDNHIIIPSAPSAARVVYEYYGAKAGFPNVTEELMDAVDAGDSAQYSIEEVLNPDRWALLNFIMDSRTGLGRFRGFRIPNYELMMELIDACRQYTIEEILELPDVKERVELYFEQTALFTEQAKRCATIHGNVVVLNLLEEDTVYVGNRFLIYALFPQCNISIHQMWGRDKQNVVFACGKSIFDRSSKTNIGELMLKYGGGGHHAAGTCQADNIIAETVRQALIQQMNEDG